MLCLCQCERSNMEIARIIIILIGIHAGMSQRTTCDVNSKDLFRTNRTGYISYPPGGTTYNPSQSCVWKFKVKQGRALRVEIIGMGISGHGRLCRDYLLLPDGSVRCGTNSLQTVCYKSRTTQCVSDECPQIKNWLKIPTISFVSRNTATRGWGFYLRYSVIDCQQDATTSSTSTTRSSSTTSSSSTTKHRPPTYMSKTTETIPTKTTKSYWTTSYVLEPANLTFTEKGMLIIAITATTITLIFAFIFYRRNRSRKNLQHESVHELAVISANSCVTTNQNTRMPQTANELSSCYVVADQVYALQPLDGCYTPMTGSPSENNEYMTIGNVYENLRLTPDVASIEDDHEANQHPYTNYCNSTDNLKV